ncbi:antibiotic biosynthesis monooxygenase [Pseudomonas fluorescens]|uniref:Antibiotic biosynthesis monooxygenase n=1 Tax=Pseudomonas fluorescens TaxID=294 RepID=A0A944DMS0_PSEFL|nr:antibiotic biosynthesis monooxygenase [Pseudomonas fluorescens]MBT2294920.1 antibiotic biosynthesis monooxygenase [Pseudomonas fluorescens]MBT2309148.1 antibiotic biosynthesis monooxygenase [Pseudomonas fluorescens]MBT2313616.1 antibiotic biosynthesis monooxygenase [Pseudomonas fluorescens]MBT2318332.1 antibiotic biosynthesis monooxygenase [Pseudomonas fluorescens]MBT2328700.1 antibiotic biosynthesis monooxygenase [Pseudomonas fluorescens]
MDADTVNEAATLVVRHRVKAGHEQQYEAWLRRVIDTASRYVGHMGIDVARSHSDGLPLFTCVLHFSCTQHLQNWLDSSERQALIAEVKPLLTDGDQIEVSTAREFWFVPASEHQPPPRWKQVCVTFLVIMPLSLIVPQLWQPLFKRITWLGSYPVSAVVVTLSIVLLVVYLFMPMVTRWLAAWLNPQPREQ